MAELSTYLVSSILKGVLKGKIAGQDNAIGVFIEGMLENLLTILEIASGRKSSESVHLKNFLIFGPTGSGKTSLVKELCFLLHFPLLEVDISSVTPSGYKGKELIGILERGTKNVPKISDEMIDRYKIFKSFIEEQKGKNKEIFLQLLRFGMLWVLFPKEYVLQNLNVDKSKFLEISSYLERELKGQLLKFKNPAVKGIVIFLDEFDKLFSIESSLVEFYSKIQEQILKLLESHNSFNFIVHSKDPVYPIFVLAGSFWNADIDKLIPEVKGRVQYRIRLNKLQIEDYKLIVKQRLSPEYFSKLFYNSAKVEIEESFYNAVAEICDSLNSKEYLGARRLNEVCEIIEKSVIREYIYTSNNTIYLTDSFVKFVFDYYGSTDAVSIDFEEFFSDSYTGQDDFNFEF